MALLSNECVTHPPRSNPPLRSSSGAPSPCITPSTVTIVVVVSFTVAAPFSSAWSARRVYSTYPTPSSDDHRVFGITNVTRAHRTSPAFTADEERPITGRPFLVPLYVPHFTARSRMNTGLREYALSEGG